MALGWDASSGKYSAEQASISTIANSSEALATSESLSQKTGMKKQISTVSALFIIFNRMVGTGIFATPSVILHLGGSVGISLLMWILGAIVATAGLNVYIVWGSWLPLNGGEKNYLEYLFPKPTRLATTLFASQAVLIAWGAGNSLVFAEYALAAWNPHPSVNPVTSPSSPLSPVRLVAFACLTSTLFLHGVSVRAGLRVQNILGFTKIGILIVLVTLGILALKGQLREGVEKPRNFESWNKIWEGTNTSGTVLCSCLYQALYGYVGFSNANYSLGEMRNPTRTLRVAGTLAVLTVTVFYLFCNVAYLAAASKEEITSSGRLVAAVLFRNVWGPKAERVLNAFVALSTLGNVYSVSFSYGRVNQELGKDGIIPFGNFWASSWPTGAPLAGLGLHWLVCMIVIFGIPEGDAFNFMISLTSYPMAVINGVISFGLLYIVVRRWSNSGANSTSLGEETPLLSQARLLSNDLPIPTSSVFLATLVFGFANVFLVVVPFLRPPKGLEPFRDLPYWAQAVGGWGMFVIGYLWWVYSNTRTRL
ncbi:high affinity methionine permease [Crepidotus variabilis]|uniref:High affinity methionine permease n=1 Tax=Crepidotus variabilis TaxID=179855 RepID=A0A9P6E4R1_9AGAR|nr:high affinity methionine permease [Crepidotus variabilis]